MQLSLAQVTLRAYNKRKKGEIPLAITYNKLLKIFEERGITSYTIKKHNIIGQATWKKVHEGGHIDTRTIDALCAYLKCQPGDILEYVPEDQLTE